MKRVLLVLLVLAFVVPAFADDALMLPQGVWRTRIIPVYSFADNAFDDDFSADRDSIDKQQGFSLGFAVEYGINDWITAAAQWTPGFVAWSDIEDNDEASVNTWFDLFLGSKFQIIGPNAPVSRNDMRLAVALSVKVPFPGADWESELEDFQAGDDFIAANVDRNVLGLGARFYYDYVFSPSFFVNFYSEFIAYPFEGEAPDVETYATIQALNAFFGADLPDDKFGHGYDLTLEIEPQYIHTVSPSLRITPSLPFTFSYSPELKLDGKDISKVEVTGAGRPFEDAGPSSSLSVSPTVEFFFTGLKVPTALEVTYRYPIAGQNASATNALIIQVKNYLKFW